MGEPACVLRAARPEDRAEIRELREGGFGAFDPHLDRFDAWLADRAGAFVVAVLDGRVVGCAKLTELDAGQWWLEGLRVHPQYRGRGVAHRLVSHRIALWRERGGGALRAQVASYQAHVQRIFVDLGLSPVATYIDVVAGPVDGDPELVQLAHGDVAWMHELLERSVSLAAARGLVEQHLQWHRPRVERLVHAGCAYGWRGRQGLVLAHEDIARDQWRVWLATSPGDQVALTRAVRGLPRTRTPPESRARVCWRVIDEPSTLAAVREAGFTERTDYEPRTTIWELVTAA